MGEEKEASLRMASVMMSPFTVTDDVTPCLCNDGVYGLLHAPEQLDVYLS